MYVMGSNFALGSQTPLFYSLIGFHLTHSNAAHVTIAPSMHQPTMMTTLAAPCTPRDPIYISLFDDCEGGSEDTVKRPVACPWLKALGHTIYWCIYSFRVYSVFVSGWCAF